MLTSLAQNYPSATFFQLQSDTLFEGILNNPSPYSATKGLRDTKHQCDIYANAMMREGGSDLGDEDKDAKCAYKVNEYFWLNGAHVTWPVHRVMAEEIVGWLKTL